MEVIEGGRTLRRLGKLLRLLRSISLMPALKSFVVCALDFLMEILYSPCLDSRVSLSLTSFAALPCKV